MDNEQRIIISRNDRIMTLLVTILLPITSFLLAIVFEVDKIPDWQSGEISDYAFIMLGGNVSMYFYPFLVYSIICMSLYLWMPEQNSKYFLVRFGIYTGAILSLQYSIISLLALSESLDYGFIAGGLLIPITLKWGYLQIKNKTGSKNAVIILVGLFLVVLIFSVSVWGWQYIPWFVIVSILTSGPFWCLVFTLKCSIGLLKCFEFSKLEKRNSVLGVLVWGIPFIGSWRLAIQKTFEIYSTLPKEAPDCYIATAAAQGHPWFVMAKPVIIEEGKIAWVNSQLRNFKCAELFFQSISPRLHRKIRTFYDVVGRKLSRTIVFPAQADLIYLLLKPIEWVSIAVMRTVVVDFEQLADIIYKYE